jgi:AraC-like DNA-binding protein
VHPDVVNAIKYLAEITEGNPMLIQAYDLCVSKYVLSRMFAKTFHCNFSKYVNGVRLNYAVAALENTMDSITNICLDCGFESQRTFNRVFKDRYKITPREYRKRMEHNNRNGRLGVRR